MLNYIFTRLKNYFKSAQRKQRQETEILLNQEGQATSCEAAAG